MYFNIHTTLKFLCLNGFNPFNLSHLKYLTTGSDSVLLFPQQCCVMHSQGFHSPYNSGNLQQLDMQIF